MSNNKKIMYDYDAKDCEQCSPDSVCCYCKNIACYKLEEQLKQKEQECEELKIYIESNEQQVKEVETLVMDNDRLINELDQLKAENEELKFYIESYKQVWELDKLKQTLAEIKEIANKTLWTYPNLDDVTKYNMFDKILQKINEIEDEKNM